MWHISLLQAVVNLITGSFLLADPHTSFFFFTLVLLALVALTQLGFGLSRVSLLISPYCEMRPFGTPGHNFLNKKSCYIYILQLPFFLFFCVFPPMFSRKDVMLSCTFTLVSSFVVGLFFLKRAQPTISLNSVIGVFSGANNTFFATRSITASEKELFTVCSLPRPRMK